MALTQIKTTGIADNAVTDAKVVDAITSSNHLPLAGGTMTGVLNMNSQNITNAGTIQGTLSTASQTNITSVGTLSSLNVSGNAVISGTLQSDDFTLDAGSGNPDLVIKTTATGSATAQMLFLTGDKDFTLINDTDNFRLYNSTPGVGVDVIKVVGSSSDILFGDVSNSRHLSLDYSNGDVVVNGNALGVGAVPRQYYKLDLYKNGNACILGMRSESHANVIYTQTGNTVTGQMEFSTSQGWITTRTASPLKLGINNAEKLTIGADGNTTFAGQALIKEGASNNLSLAFSNDTDTGIYRGGDGATAFVQNAGIALELQASLTAEFRGLIKHKGTSNSDYGNTAFETRSGNNSQGLKISHGGGNGKLEIFGGNQSRTQFYANQITANVNGLEIKTTDAQSLTLGTNNSTRVTVDSSGNATFAEKILMTKESVIQQVADETKGFMFNGGGGTTFGYPNVQGSGLYGMVFGRESIAAAGGGHYIAKSHWGGISIIGFSGSGVQGIDIVAWGYGNGGATVLKSGNWVGSLYRSYSTVNYHLVVDVGTDVTMFSILIGI